jgi:hypothetical protein
VVDEEDQPLVPFTQGVDEVEVLGAGGLCVGCAGVTAELASGEQSAEAVPTRLGLDEADRATRTTAGVREFGADNGARPREPWARTAERGVRILEALGGFEEFHHAGAVIDVGEGEGGELEGCCALEEGARGVDAREEGVVAVDAQGDVTRRGTARRGATGAVWGDPYGAGVVGGGSRGHEGTLTET